MARVNTYDIRIPEGAGAGYKVDRVPAPPIGGTCFQNMQSVADLDATCRCAPGEHNVINERLKRIAKVRAEAKQGTQPRTVIVKAQHFTFSKGATVKDLSTGRKGIIIKANASYTKKSHSPVHMICDENGDTWFAKEKHLKLKH
jgi:hypothetical protein